MRVNVASETSPCPLSRPHQSSPPPSPPVAATASLSRRRGLRWSESAIFGPTTALRLSRSSRPPPLRRSSSASCYFGEFSNHHHSNHRDFTPSPAPTTEPFCPSKLDLLEPSLLGIPPEPPDWPAREDLIRDSIARRANCMELPLSLRMIKKKKKHQQLFREKGSVEEVEKGSMGGDGDASISRAFSSTVFVIRELHSHALQLKEDVEAIAEKVQTEMNSSFIWLFREVFSRTPDLMADVMVLTVDFTAHSMEKHKDQLIGEDDSLMISEKVEEVDEKATEDEAKASTFMGNGDVNGGDSKKTELLGGLANMIQYPNVVVPGESSHPQEASSIENGGVEICEEEKKLWDAMVEEASRMQREGVKVDEEPRSEMATLDHGSMQQFVSPMTVEIEADDYDEYYRTDFLYQIGVYQEPNNPLLLSNYAQFLYLVTRDYDRAEECFQRAIQLDSSDAEVLSQYATFLWVIRKDVWGAEERYQQAMAAEPDNPYHASKYANFLWSTGGEETYYPVDAPPSKK